MVVLSYSLVGWLWLSCLIVWLVVVVLSYSLVGWLVVVVLSYSLVGWLVGCGCLVL